mgnify:CR=1 FL=1
MGEKADARTGLGGGDGAVGRLLDVEHIRVSQIRGGVTMQELKPCPFCGGKAEVESASQKYSGYRIRCGNLDCHVPCGTFWHDSEAGAAEVWNRRAET